MRGLLLCVLLLSGAAARAELSPEHQLMLQSLRAGERERVERALGPIDGLPFYRVELDVAASGEVTGKVQIQVTAGAETLKEVHLRVTPNAMDPDRVRLSNCKVNGQAAVLERPEPSLFRVPLDPWVPPGAAVTIEVRLKARVPEAPPQRPMTLQSQSASGAAGSAAKTDHGAFSSGEDLISLVGIVPQIPPTEQGAPIQGPAGIGDLALYGPSHFLASIRVPRGHRAHCTGVALGEVPDRDGSVRFAFGAAASRDFPVLVSRGYERRTAKLDDVELESWFLKSDAETGERVLEIARSALAEFQKRFGPYPYKTFRIVEAPLQDGAGGMEFPGLITVASFLYRAQEDPGAALGMPGLGALMGPVMGEMLSSMLEFTVAHEVAHQYFAGVVGSDPVRHPVVDESLAQYAALLFIEWRHGREAAALARDNHLVMPYHLYRMNGGADAVADRPASEFESELQYGAVVYGKAPLLHEAERKLLGDATFLKGLRGYVEAYRWKWACADCFTEALAQKAPMQAQALRALRRRWWTEANGDRDLGKPDPAKMLGPLLGAGQQGGMDPQTLQMFMDALRALEGMQ